MSASFSAYAVYRNFIYEANSLLLRVVLRKNSSREGFQLIVMMQAAETRVGNDAMSGW